ncbi:Fe-S cluster assembly scaffold SufA [Bartonella sp. A05]|uniref:Fe-S cluster assembly scaffold SufA n=1 Tax=Bartonella sp. A05 TaxID=2967261 RepID=UPI0022A94ADF|nr:Fe-S cluster assembly scaffold SufA [Bartonella sp. A05]MCZ2204198.1 Fe-S cluster assembly scaffold SufA [Bartonella sp. A05]
MNRFSVISLTEAAIARVKAIMESKDAHGILIGIKKGGCAGMEYSITLVKEEMPDADIVEANGARVFIARDAILFLLGTQMDYEVTTLRSGFIFNNPNQISACGCGESVEIRPALQNEFDEMYKTN